MSTIATVEPMSTDKDASPPTPEKHSFSQILGNAVHFIIWGDDEYENG